MQKTPENPSAAPLRETSTLYAVSSPEKPTLELVITLASRLAASEQLQVIQSLAEQLSRATSTRPTSGQQGKSSRPLRGLWADFGPAPTAEEIDESRREMLRNFPREDIV